MITPVTDWAEDEYGWASNTGVYKTNVRPARLNKTAPQNSERVLSRKNRIYAH